MPIGRDPITGKPKYRSRSVKGTRKEAERKLRELRTEVESSGGDVTFGQLLTQWIDAARDTMSPTTAKEYERLIEKRIRPVLGSQPLWKLSAWPTWPRGHRRRRGR